MEISDKTTGLLWGLGVKLYCILHNNHTSKLTSRFLLNGDPCLTPLTY
jgi:hypothetical protein